MVGALSWGAKTAPPPDLDELVRQVVEGQITARQAHTAIDDWLQAVTGGRLPGMAPVVRKTYEDTAARLHDELSDKLMETKAETAWPGDLSNLPPYFTQSTQLAAGVRTGQAPARLRPQFPALNLWPIVLVGLGVGVLLLGGVWLFRGRRHNPKKKDDLTGFQKVLIGGGALAGLALVAFPDPVPGAGPSSVVGWPLLIGSLAAAGITIARE